MRKLQLLIFLLLALPVFAFDSWISPDSVTIYPNETAVLNLVIINSGMNLEGFDVFSDVVWDLRTGDPLIVPPNSTLSTDLFLRALSIKPGLYKVPISVRRSGSDEVNKLFVTVDLLSNVPSEQEYLPAIIGKVSSVGTVDPRTPMIIDVELSNRKKIQLDKLDIKVRSKLVNVDAGASLGPLERKKISISTKLDDITAPQNDSLRVSVFAYDSKGKSYQFDLDPVNYEISDFSAVEALPSSEKDFLKVIRRVSIKNRGNVAVVYDYSFDLGFISSLFTKSIPAPVSRNVWRVELGVGESSEIVMVTNYWPLVVFIGVVLLIIIAYFMFRSPIIVFKEARILKTREGGVQEMKILLHVKNRSQKSVLGVSVRDSLPQVLELSSKNDDSTVSPAQVLKHEHRGYVIRWELGVINPREERIVAYRAVSKYPILGGLTLPLAVAKYRAGSRERNASSNTSGIKL